MSQNVEISMKLHSLLTLVLMAALVGPGTAGAQAPAPGAATAQPPAPKPGTTALATFGGGCFWCMEEAFDKIPGVIATTSGYMGGQTKDPTYEQVSSGRTGHGEVVQVEYDTGRVTYEKLLESFWRSIDPTQKDAQFCDHGSQYRSAIFYHRE